MKKNDFVEVLNFLKANSRCSLLEQVYSNFLNAFLNVRFNIVQTYTPEPLAEIYGKIRYADGVQELEIFRKIMILECLLNSWDDCFSEKYPQSIRMQFKKNFERMLNLCNDDKGWRELNTDDYWKDLAIARQQIFPAGAGVVETYSGFGFRQGFSVNPIQSLKFLKLLFLSGGKKGYYQIHTHTPLLGDFNEQGWLECYIRISEMLIKHQEIKGVFRASWFCDPDLVKISPRLGYLHKMPVDNGAKVFYIQEDKTGNPFVKSKTRLKLYKKGQYRPKTYLLVWPRKELIKWAKN